MQLKAFLKHSMAVLLMSFAILMYLAKTEGDLMLVYFFFCSIYSPVGGLMLMSVQKHLRLKFLPYLIATFLCTILAMVLTMVVIFSLGT
ncbi:Uncharacterised protein [Aedoeadaptatus ivorii]|uniref:Uncharacterized protein n=1 Tax=Aedoeadaptatus ivorii TaxID=54006 RepID=A0A3S4Y692_9FIRM|nr:hypothetical protein [Peptoniphilus ivorii]VEJ34519.1 Uncharacterised protein [Peptoniphilus ivorii]